MLREGVLLVEVLRRLEELPEYDPREDDEELRGVYDGVELLV
ncbi:hypothetical protein N8529_00305 [bacterium]|nr:hypothetical protein [bacterium]